MYMVLLLSQKQLLCPRYSSPNRSVNQRKENGPKFEIDHFCLQVINHDYTSED